MRREALELFIETSMPKGCVTCKKLHLRCDERKPACKRCIHSGRTCEGYVCVSTARKPTDVTPESILEFRQRCFPSREHPKKALIVLPVEQPRMLYSIVSKNISVPDEIMHHILRAVVSGRKKESEVKEKRGKEREMSLIKFHEPVKSVFDLSKPEGCPVIRSAFMIQMYHLMIDIMMSRAHPGGTTAHGISVSCRRK